MNALRETVARAIYEARNGAGCKPWSRQSDAHKAPYLADADAALLAMGKIVAKEYAA